MTFMKRILVSWLVAMTASVLLFAVPGWADDKSSDNDQSDVVKRIQASTDVLNEIMGAPDKAIPEKVLGDARCIAVVPSMVKIAVGFGGNHGKGVATCRTDRGWSAPAPITMTGGSFGLQLGGQAVDVVMLVMNEKGMDSLLSSKFKLGGDASAAAGPIGRDAAADTDWKMKAEVLTYSRARGVFAGVDLTGSSITQDKDETRILYGKMEPFKDILYGHVPAPKGSNEFLHTLAKYAPNTPNPKQSSSAPGQASAPAGTSRQQ
jgi:lipid-binding SYLF domain-containing protein